MLFKLIANFFHFGKKHFKNDPYLVLYILLQISTFSDLKNELNRFEKRKRIFPGQGIH